MLGGWEFGNLRWRSNLQPQTSNLNRCTVRREPCAVNRVPAIVYHQRYFQLPQCSTCMTSTENSRAMDE